MFSPYPWAPRWSSGKRGQPGGGPAARGSPGVIGSHGPVTGGLGGVVRCPRARRVMTRWVCCGVRQGAGADLVVRRETGPGRAHVRGRRGNQEAGGGWRGGPCDRVSVSVTPSLPWSMDHGADCSAGHTLPCWDDAFGALCTDTTDTGPVEAASQTCGALCLATLVAHCDVLLRMFGLRAIMLDETQLGFLELDGSYYMFDWMVET